MAESNSNKSARDYAVSELTARGANISPSHSIDMQLEERTRQIQKELENGTYNTEGADILIEALERARARGLERSCPFS